MWPKSPRIRANDVHFKHSDDSKKNSPRAPYNKTVLGSQQKKRRPQGIDHRLQKRLQSVENKENMQIMNVRKAVLLTPSSSNTSLSTSVSSAGESSYKVQPKMPATPPPYFTLKRQHTATMLSYRARKSVSQMDFKEARRTGGYQLVAHVPNANALVPTARATESQLTIKDENLAQLLMQDANQLNSPRQGNVRFVVNGDQDVRVASLRIFNTIMLRSWRRRREEVRHLTEQVEDFKRNFVKNRNQLHVYNTLFAVEKRRNDTLNDQLKQSYMDSAQTKLSNNELTILLTKANEEKQQLAQENACKQQEIDNLQELLETTKKELFQTHTLQREQLEQLTRVQRECQDAKFDIEELSEKLEAMKIELKQKQEHMDKMRENIALLADQLKLSGTRLTEHKCETEIQLGKLMKHSDELELDLKQKKEQIINLENCLAATIGHRIRQCLANRQAYQHATYNLMHFVAYCMLPGTPPPALPCTTLPGAVKKLKGIFTIDSNGPAKGAESKLKMFKGL